MSNPTILSVTRRNGVAGQVAYAATVQYPDEPAMTLAFIGSTYGGPVVMISADGTEAFVMDAVRFGEFGESWVRRFYGEDGLS